jgi:catechol 2,3-dioxygenase-like lactoylglutathione lyase family enzyme
VLGKALAHPTVFVRDLERARAFYENLGLTVTAEVSTGIFMTAGDGTIFPLLHRPEATPPPHTVAAFQVDDLPSVVASLRARGVSFEEYDSPSLRTIDGIVDMGAYRAAWLKDPDGNFIGLHEPPTRLPKGTEKR